MTPRLFHILIEALELHIPDMTDEQAKEEAVQYLGKLYKLVGSSPALPKKSNIIKFPKRHALHKRTLADDLVGMLGFGVNEFGDLIPSEEYEYA